MSDVPLQSFGLVVLLVLTVIGFGGLIVGISVIIQTGATTADSERIADEISQVLSPDRTGPQHHTIDIGDGEIKSEPRTIRVLAGIEDDGDERTANILYRHDGEALRYQLDNHGVTASTGAVILETRSGASMYQPPQITSEFGTHELITLTNLSTAETADNTNSLLELQVSNDYERHNLSTRDRKIAIETRYPDLWSEYFATRGFDSVSELRFGNDKYPSVVAQLDEERPSEVLVHEITLEEQQ